jgi:hypothetical protein
MLNSSRFTGFLLFIEEKNTRTNVAAWKKTFYGWLELFKEFPSELINSVGWIITKCPPEINEESVSKRLRFLQSSIKNDKAVDSALIDKIFDTIIDNGRFYIFKKGSGSEEA